MTGEGTMTQLTLPLQERLDWSPIQGDRTDLTTLARRSAFLRDLKGLRSALEHVIPRLNGRKGALVDRARKELEIEKYNEETASKGRSRKDAAITAYIAQAFQITPQERNQLTQFLRRAYPGSRENRWEDVHDAELFNTARHVYHKAGGYAAFKLDELLHRAASDRENRERLASVIPLFTGIGVIDRVTYERDLDRYNTAVAIRTPWPVLFTAYTTTNQYWVALTPLGEKERVQLGGDPATQLARASDHVDAHAAMLQEKYRFRELEVRTARLDPKREFSI